MVGYKVHPIADDLLEAEGILSGQRKLSEAQDIYNSERHETVRKEVIAHHWQEYDRLLAVLISNREASKTGLGWQAWKNKRCDSIIVTISMNGHKVDIRDRDGHLMTIDDLEFQYKAPPEKPKKGWRIRQWFGLDK